MEDDVFPTVRVEAVDATTMTIRMPTENMVAYPRIPEELHGKEIPAFVAEWIAESDEIGVCIQELLQAPTQSLCRLMPVVAANNLYQTWSGKQIRATEPYSGGFQRSGWDDVRGFKGESDIIDGLPEGVVLPRRLEETIELAQRVAIWLEKGRRVREWLDAEGYGDLRWLPEEAPAQA